MKNVLSCTPDTVAGNTTTAPVTDKRGFGARWLFSIRHVDNLLAAGLPHCKIGKRRVRIIVTEADQWMKERFGTQRRGAARRQQTPAQFVQP